MDAFLALATAQQSTERDDNFRRRIEDVKRRVVDEIEGVGATKYLFLESG